MTSLVFLEAVTNVSSRSTRDNLGLDGASVGVELELPNGGRLWAKLAFKVFELKRVHGRPSSKSTN